MEPTPAQMATPVSLDVGHRAAGLTVSLQGLGHSVTDFFSNLFFSFIYNEGLYYMPLCNGSVYLDILLLLLLFLLLYKSSQKRICLESQETL